MGDNNEEAEQGKAITLANGDLPPNANLAGAGDAPGRRVPGVKKPRFLPNRVPAPGSSDRAKDDARYGIGGDGARGKAVPKGDSEVRQQNESARGVLRQENTKGMGVQHGANNTRLRQRVRFHQKERSRRGTTAAN